MGVQILKRALEMPTVRSQKTLPSMAESSSFAWSPAKGITASMPGAGKYVDLVEAGIIDSSKVVRIALENAVSVASVLLLTEATMTEISEAKKEQTLGPEMAM